jgi:integrase
VGTEHDAVIPVAPVVMEEARRYLSRYWDRFEMGLDAPLFPGEDLTRSVSAETVNEWWHRAKVLAAEDGRALGMSPHNARHGFRQNRRTELRTVHDKYARWLVGHSVLSGTPGISVSEGQYLGLVPEDLVAAVGVGTGEPSSP